MKNPTAHNQIGLWLKRKRSEAGISQAQLAMTIGRSKSFVGRYEKGRRLEIEQFIRISQALNANPHEMVQTLYMSDMRN